MLDIDLLRSIAAQLMSGAAALRLKGKSLRVGARVPSGSRPSGSP